MKSKIFSLRLVALHLLALAGILLMQGCATGQCPIDAFNWPYNEPTHGPTTASEGDFPIMGEESDTILLPPMIDTVIGTSFEVPDEPSSGETYVVRKGDTLSGIASRYGTSWKKLATSNNLSNPNKLLVGQEIVIPAGLSASSAPITRSAAPKRAVRSSSSSSVSTGAPIAQGSSYIIQKGDSLSRIASRSGLTITEIKAANALTSNVIIAGKSLSIPKKDDVSVTVFSEPAASVAVKDKPAAQAPIVGLAPLAPSTSAPVYEHILYPGETLDDVARQFGSSKDEIMLLNGISDPSTLRPGTKLLVPIPE